MGARAASHMRGSDAFAWYMEHDPMLRSTIVAISWLDRAPDWDRLVTRIDRATRLVPMFRQRIVVPPLRLATPRFTTDPDFDLAWHLRRVEAPAPKTRETVMAVARQEAMDDFDRARPLWRFTVVEGLDGGEAALVMKIHHSLTDGIGGIQLAMLVVDFERDATDPPLPEAPAAGRFTGPAVLVDAVLTDLEQAGELAWRQARAALPTLATLARHPLGSARRFLTTVGSVGRMVAPVTETLSPLMTQRSLRRELAFLDVPTADLKRAAKTAGGTLNDAFMAGITGGLRRYHEVHGTTVGELRVTLPISLRAEDDPMGGNRITLMRFAVPVGDPDPVFRMRAIHRRCRDVRDEPAVPHTNGVATGLNLLPAAVIGGMLKHVDFLASNVPGIPVPVYLAGAQVTGYYAFGPTIGASVNVTLLSYAGVCNIGVNIDTAAVPDPDVLMRCLHEGFDEVVAVGKPAARAARPKKSA